MQPNYIQLTTAGKQAINVADANGVKIQPVTFRVGDYDQDEPPALAPDDLLGNEICAGKIRYVQTLSTQMVRFSFVVPEGISGLIGEVCFYLKDGTCLGHATLSPKRNKSADDSLLIELLLHLTEGETSNIDVTMAEFGSIPSVASVDDLSNPVSSNINAVSVLTLIETPDLGTCAGVALRHGDGGQYWSFDGYSRIFLGNIGSNVISPAEFTPSTVLGEVLAQGTCLVQVVSGTGAGESRICDYSTTVKCRNKGFSNLAEDSQIAVWVPRSDSAGSSLPPRSGLPADYVLYCGVDAPFWGAAKSSGSSSGGGKLYSPPSKLIFTSIHKIGDGSRFYKAEDLVCKDSNHIIASLNGIWQQRLAFEATEEGIEFAEELNADYNIDMRIASRQSTSGTYVDVKIANHVADGYKRKFALPAIPETIDSVFVFAQSVTISSNAYKITDDGYIEFNEPPEAGRSLEFRVLDYSDVEGNYTVIESGLRHVAEASNVWILPIEPESKGHVFFSEQGLMVPTSNYEIVGNKVVFSSTMRVDSVIEFWCLQNRISRGSKASNLEGVVVGAIHTCKGIEVLRHDMPPLRIPNLIPTIRSEDIKITGKWPDLILSLDSDSGKSSGTLLHSDSNVRSVKNSLELVWPIKVPITQDCIIQVTADFSAILGPANLDTTGYESVHYVLQIKKEGSNDLDYGRRVRGSGAMGFSILPTSSVSTDEEGYANASITQQAKILAASTPSNNVDVIAKMRLNNVDVDKLKSFTSINVSLMVYAA